MWPRKILVLATSLWPPGGVERYSAQLVTALADLIGDDGVDVLPVWQSPAATVARGRLVRRGQVGGRLGTTGRGRYVLTGLAAVARRRPDVIVTAHPHLAAAGAVLAAAAGSPLVVVVHGREAWQRGSVSVRWGLRRAHAVWSVSRFTAEQVVAAQRVDARRVHVLPPGLPAPVGRLEGGAREPEVLAVARLTHASRYKGVDTLVRCWPAVRRAVPGARLAVVGDGPARASLESSAPEGVWFVGAVDDAELARRYRSAAVFALPSRTRTGPGAEGEGFGLVYLEAALAGLPVIAGGGGAAEAVVDGVTGMVVDPLDDDAVTGALVALLSDPARAAELGSAGRRWAEAELSVERFRSRVEAGLATLATSASPPRAVLVDHAPVLGGAEQSLVHLVRRLPAHGVAVEVVTGSAALAEQAERAGARVHALDLPRLRGARRPAAALDAVRLLRRVLTSAPNTVAVANTTRAAPYVAAAARSTRVPFVWYVRDFSTAEGRPRWPVVDRAVRLILQGAARTTIAVSDAVADGLIGARIVVIHNGTDVPAPDGDGTAFRRRWFLPAASPVVGVVGRLRPWKGQDRFLTAMKLVAVDRPDVRLVVAGSGGEEPDAPFEQHLQALARTAALKGRVTFCGWVDGTASLYGALDVVVHAGDPEPFGLTVVEAMSHGVPVVGFAHGALPELIDDGATGILVPPGDLRALALAVADLIADDGRRERLGAAARRAASGRFDADATARRVADVLRRASGR